MSCGFNGNSDIYGIGLRIGYYAQALAVWYSNYFNHEEVKSLRTVNNIFLFALLVAAIIYFANATTTHVIEGFLLLQIGLMMGLVSITESSGFSPQYVKRSKDRMILEKITWFAGALFNACFWWWAVDVMLPTPCNGAGSRHDTKIFYFYMTSIYGWAGWLMKIKTLLGVVWAVPTKISMDVRALFYEYRMREARAEFVRAVTSLIPTEDSFRRGYSIPPTEHSTKDIKSSLHRASDAREVQGVSPPCIKSLKENDAKEPPKAGHTDTIKSIVIDLSQHREMLKGVDRATKYMEDILSIYPKESTKPKRPHLRSCRDLIQIISHESQCTDTLTPYTRCLWIYFSAQLINKPSLDLRYRIGRHLNLSGHFSVWRWPRLVHRMCIFQETSPPPDWHHLVIASDSLLIQTPPIVKIRTWMYHAASEFAVVVFMVLQVELTIKWNHVEGLDAFDSLGQLIAFCLGVGGLFTVIWGKRSRVCDMGKGEWGKVCKMAKEEWTGGVEKGEYEMALERWLRWKEVGGERRIERTMTV